MATKKIRLQFHGGDSEVQLGRRTRPATVNGIGYLFQGEIMQLDLVKKEEVERAGHPSETVTWWHVIGPRGVHVKLSSEQWRELKGLCQYLRLDSSFCSNDPEPGENFCRAHLLEQNMQKKEGSGATELDIPESETVLSKQEKQKRKP